MLDQFNMLFSFCLHHLGIVFTRNYLFNRGRFAKSKDSPVLNLLGCSVGFPSMLDQLFNHFLKLASFLNIVNRFGDRNWHQV